MKNSARTMFIFGVITFIVISVVSAKTSIPFNTGEDTDTFLGWVFRLISALAASAISISIPGMLEIRYTQNKGGSGLEMLRNPETQEPEPANLAEREPTITASGAIAVFVLVYLFNPIG
nr:hypothetical protein [Allomuricauda sp.]